jgi:hypothetical protein
MLFVAPILSNNPIKYNIDAYIVRTNELGDTDWSFYYRIANNTSQPGMYSGFTRIIECSTGGFVFVSPILNRINGVTYWGLSLVRIDKDGIILWEKNFNDYNVEMGFSLVEVDYKGYAIAGTTQHYDSERNTLDRDIFIIQTDFNGNLKWAETYKGFNSDWASSIITCKSGGFAIVGKTEYYCETCSDILMLRIDSKGQVQWNYTYGGISHDVGYSIVECNDGGFAISGSTKANECNDTDVLLLRLDQNGNEQWNCTYGIQGNEDGWSLIQRQEGGFSIGGTTTSQRYPQGRLADAIIILTDENGTLLKKKSLYYNSWARVYGYYFNSWGYSMSESNEVGYTIVGTVTDMNYREWDIILFHIDTNGNLLLNRTYGDLSYDYGYSLVNCSDEGYAIAGVKVTPI